MSADELEQLLQFLYRSPVGMVDFDDEGAIRLINPQAVNLLAPTVGVGDASNVFAILAKAWPELARLVRRPGRPAQRLVEGHRVSGGPPEAPWRLSLDLVRVAPGRNMLALTDLTEAARREAEARALAGQLGESTERLEESRLAMARQRALLAAVVGAAPVGIALHDSRLRCAAMGRLRAATAALAGRLEPSPAGLLSALDDFARGPDGVSFATAACVIVDPASGLLTYSSAGHPPPLVVSPDRECVTLDAASSPPLCTQLRRARGDASVRLAPGSLVVVYTDGLVERRGERFNVGLDRLRAAAVELYDRPLAEIADELTAAMTASRPPQDDMVVACLRFAPAAARLALRVPARPGELAGVRRELRRWLTERQITGRHQRLVLLAAGEACTNAIEHGYRGRRDGHIELELSDHRHHLTLQVGDRGAWRPPSSLPLHHRGRGTTIMRSVASHFERASKAEGTAVTLALPAPLRPGLDR